MCVCAQSCPTLCNSIDCGLSGSSVHGIFQIKILERVAISYSRGSSWPRDQTPISCVSCTARWVLYQCATWEAYLLTIGMHCSYNLVIWRVDFAPPPRDTWQWLETFLVVPTGCQGEVLLAKPVMTLNTQQCTRQPRAEKDLDEAVNRVKV